MFFVVALHCSVFAADEERMLEKLSESYSRLKSFQMDETVIIRNNGSEMKQEKKLIFSRPNRVYCKCAGDTVEGRDEGIIVCNGEKLFVYRVKTGEYRTEKAPSTLTEMSAMAGGLNFLILPLLDGNLNAFLRDISTVNYGGEVQKENKKYLQLTFTWNSPEENETLRLFLNPDTFLISIIEGEVKSLKSDNSFLMKLSYRNIGKDFTRSTFTFSPPPGAKEMKEKK